MASDSILSVKAPLDAEAIASLKAGQMVRFTGTILTARDAAHKKMVQMLKDGEELGFEIDGQVVYYAGPCPAKPGQVIGSVGPTTSGRMDVYSPYLISKGLKIMIGKGLRSAEVKSAIKEHGGLYFAAIGGAAAIMAKCVKQVEIIAFDELGTEAVRRLQVEDLPLIVAVDSQGGDIYAQGAEQYKIAD